MATLDETDLDAPAQSRRAADELRGVREWCRRRAARKQDWAKRIAPLRLAELPHEQIRIRVGLTVEEYRRAKRWLNDAVAICATAPHPLTLGEALQDIAERHVEHALRLGLLRRQRKTRQQIREALGLGDEEYEIADEWWRDGAAAIDRQQQT